MAPCRLEISLQRLLRRCEAMANERQDNKQGVEWRLEKYVESLQNELTDLQKMESKPNADKMSEYTKRVNFLKGLIETERKESIKEKAIASQHLSRPVSHLPSITDTNPQKVNELHIITKARIGKEMRNELLGTNSQDIRNRRQGGDSSKEKENIDAVLQYHQNMQEKIADEMVKMAQSLKHNSVMAKNIIQQDTKSLEASTRLVDSNSVKLKHESDRLEEIKGRQSMWMWLALALVVFVFISTILFIRVFPKK